MSFSDVLKEMTGKVEGAEGAVIVGMDGIIVEEFIRKPGMDLQSVGAEYGNILKEVQNVSGSLGLGPAREVSVRTDVRDLIIRKINDDYFLVLVLSKWRNRQSHRQMFE